MLPQLNNIHKAYTQTPNETGCNPISLFDCQIIEEIIRIVPSHIAPILSMWKAVPDETFMDTLLNYGEQTISIENDRGKERGKEHRPYPYIRLGNKVMGVYYIRSIDLVERYNEDGEQVFSLIINKEPMPQAFEFYTNTTFDYYSEEERNDVYEELKSKMEEFGYCKFI